MIFCFTLYLSIHGHTSIAHISDRRLNVSHNENKSKKFEKRFEPPLPVSNTRNDRRALYRRIWTSRLRSSCSLINIVTSIYPKYPDFLFFQNDVRATTDSQLCNRYLLKTNDNAGMGSHQPPSTFGVTIVSREGWACPMLQRYSRGADLPIQSLFLSRSCGLALAVLKYHKRCSTLAWEVDLR